MANSRKDWRNFERRREEALGQSGKNYATGPSGVDNYAYDGRSESSLGGNKFYRDNYGPSGINNPNSSDLVQNYGKAPGNSVYSQQQQVAPSPYYQEPHSHNAGKVQQQVEQYEDDNPIEKNRKCRDVLCLGFFVAAVALMVVVAGYAVVKGDLRRFDVGNRDNCDVENNTSLADKSSLQLNSNKVDPRVAFDDVKTFYEDIAEDFENSWKELIYMSLIALGITIIMTFLLRLFAGVIIWVVVIGVSLASIAGSITLWVIWFQRKKDYDNEIEGAWTKSRINGLMVGAIVASVLTLLLLLVLLFMRKRIALVIRLFNEAGKAIHAMPLLLIQPLATFTALGISFALWFLIVLLLEFAGDPELRTDVGVTYCFYKKNWFLLFSRWWNLFMMYWLSQFIIGCQHLIIAGAVSTWFFTRNKSRIGFPIITSFKRLLRFHLGTIAFGSLIIAIVKLIRYILNWISNRLSGTNAFCKGLLCCCKCCLWCLENFLQFLNRNAYIEVAIHGYGFCKSARKAFKVIVNNALRMAAINSIGDFVLFLGKITVVAATVAIGHEILKAKGGMNYIWAPLIVAAICAYLIAHCFISVYEMAIDTVFICFCEDCEMNDGISKPYFMSKGLMEFVKNSEKALKARKERKKQ